MPAIRQPKSHYLLPLNSMIFNSKSSANLPLESQRDIKTKSTTTIAHIPVEEQDDDITALPPPPAMTVLQKYNTTDFAASSLRSASSDEERETAPRRVLKRSRSMDDLVAGGKKPSIWRRFVAALKKPFRAEKQPEKPKVLVISGPSGFQHLQTGSACLFGQHPSVNNDTAESDTAEDDTTEGNTEDWETERASGSFHG